MTGFRIGSMSYAVTGAVALAMCIISGIKAPQFLMSGHYGLCFPSPSEWQIPAFLSWLLNMGLLGVITFAIISLNRTFNFVRTTRPVLPAIFLIFIAFDPWITGRLSSSLILCGVNLVCLWILFECYEGRNVTQQMFAIATFVSVGSMFQYAFLPMGLVYILAAILMKEMRFREALAFLLGLIAPWWVVMGLGIVRPDDFLPPSPFPLFAEGAADDIFLLLVGTGVMIFIGIVCGFANSMRIYAGNSRVSAMNIVIYWLGIACLLCILFDSGNIFTYLATLSFCAAVQVANFCALRQLPHEWLMLAVPGLFYIIIFSFMVF